jgi:hypothetical protein
LSKGLLKGLQKFSYLSIFKQNVKISDRFQFSPTIDFRHYEVLEYGTEARLIVKRPVKGITKIFILKQFLAKYENI